MKAKVLIVIIACFLTCNIFAYTKQDIIDYAMSQEVCDSKTSAVFNSYRNTFTRLVKQKALSENQCNQIMSYLKNSVGILNSKGICSLSDLDKLTTSEKNTIYSSLSAGASIIINAPTEGFEEDNTEDTENGDTSTENSNSDNSSQGSSGININKSDGTIDIYENGVLIDKVELNQEKLTYTGPSKANIIIIVLILLLTISIGIFAVIYSKHTKKLRFVKNILVSIQIMSIVTLVGILIIKPKLNTIENIISVFNTNISDAEKEVFVTNDKTIIYPSYGYVYGKLLCDRLNINVNVAFGDSTDILSSLAGTASWSSLPTEGKNIVISAHNNKDMFGNLENIKVGDKLVLDTNYAKCTYKVYDTNIILDTEVDKVKLSTNNETLVIYTCYPFSQYIYSNKRFVVYSALENVEWK